MHHQMLNKARLAALPQQRPGRQPRNPARPWCSRSSAHFADSYSPLPGNRHQPAASGIFACRSISARKIAFMIWNPRGSIWHRWDLHMHAPGTLLADQFGGDWEAYLTAIEDSDPRPRSVVLRCGVCNWVRIFHRRQRRYRRWKARC